MKEIQITYTILETILVPDELTDDEIEEECKQHWYDTEMNYNDLEWEVRQ